MLIFIDHVLFSPGAELEAAVQSSLRAVNLWNNSVADKQARQYSGGMKRRLSVAISFIGDPLVVYLDEPSTVRTCWCVGTASMLGGGGRGVYRAACEVQEAALSVAGSFCGNPLVGYLDEPRTVIVQVMLTDSNDVW
jgi:hypothetical protein